MVISFGRTILTGNILGPDGQSFTVKHVKKSITAAVATEVVALVASKILRVIAFEIQNQNDGDLTVQFIEDVGGTDNPICEVRRLKKNIGWFSDDTKLYGYWETIAGKSLGILPSAAKNIRMDIWYVEID